MGRAGSQSDFRQAEGVVLVVHLLVKAPEAAFGDAEHALHPCAALGMDHGAEGMFCLGAGGYGQEQPGHQVFKGRAAPADVGRALAHANQGPVQPGKMTQRNLPAHHRDKAEQLRFAGQQVVVGGRGLPCAGVHPDMEQLCREIEQPGKGHARCKGISPLRQGDVFGGDFPQVGAQPLGQGNQAGAQVAAVHAGYKGRIQHGKRVCDVPVVGQTVPQGQPLQGGQRLIHPAA